MTRIIVIPDVQAKPGTDFTFLNKIGQYIVEKKPEVLIQIGDFADMQSLSSYDKGKKSFEGRRYIADIQASKDAMTALLAPIVEYNERAKRNKEKLYKPRMVLTLGNHEDRINRAVNDEPQLAGLLTVDALEYEKFGWEVIQFLQVVIIHGIAFSHYFTTGLMGRPAGTAVAQLRVTNMSCFAGHQQGKQITYGKRADGEILTSIISGSCYEHDEGYLSSQGNKHWRGFWVLNDVNNGAFDEMPVSLSYIAKKYV